MNTSAAFFAEEYWHFDGPRVENGVDPKRDNERAHYPGPTVHAIRAGRKEAAGKLDVC